LISNPNHKETAKQWQISVECCFLNMLKSCKRICVFTWSLCAFLAFGSRANAEVFTFTGKADTFFNNPQNWDKGSVPGKDDEVIIEGKDVTIAQNHTVKRLEVRKSTVAQTKGGSLEHSPDANNPSTIQDSVIDFTADFPGVKPPISTRNVRFVNSVLKGSYIYLGPNVELKDSIIKSLDVLEVENGSTIIDNGGNTLEAKTHKYQRGTFRAPSKMKGIDTSSNGRLLQFDGSILFPVQGDEKFIDISLLGGAILNDSKINGNILSYPNTLISGINGSFLKGTSSIMGTIAPFGIFYFDNLIMHNSSTIELLISNPSRISTNILNYGNTSIILYFADGVVYDTGEVFDLLSFDSSEGSPGAVIALGGNYNLAFPAICYPSCMSLESNTYGQRLYFNAMNGKLEIIEQVPAPLGLLAPLYLYQASRRLRRLAKRTGPDLME
jgi:hypothetical protein